MQWSEFSFYIRHFTLSQQKSIQKAFDLAQKAHEGQKRESGEEYFTHPVAVARLLIDMGADADTIIAALLHDTVEDTSVTMADIEGKFPAAVARLIDGLTKLNYEDVAHQASLNEKIETIRKIFTVMQTDIRIMTIKLADRLHNMQTIGFRPIEKQRRVAQETMDIYVKIADRLCMRRVRDELESMSLQILKPDLMPHLLEIRRKNEETSKSVLTSILQSVERNVRKLPFTILIEEKSWDNLQLQYSLEQKGRIISPLINLAFVCKDVEDCYTTLGILHQTWQRDELSFQDYINTPIINGYEAIHTTIIMENGMRIQCKIRTTDMQEYAWKGITTRCFDAKERGLLDYLPWTKHISPVSQDTANRSDIFWLSLQNDILGESILVHGEGNNIQLLPAQSTALDAVFYLYGEKGIYTKEIYINDQPAAFHTELENSCTIQASFDGAVQVKLEWLRSVHTGVAAAMIRESLSKQDKKIKQDLGQALLEEYLRQKRRGYISEFDRNVIEKNLSDQRQFGLDILYEQIAEGRMTVEEVESILFQQTVAQKKSSLTKKRLYTFICDIATTSLMPFGAMMQMYDIRKMKVLKATKERRKLEFEIRLSEGEKTNMSIAMNQLAPGKYEIAPTISYYRRIAFTCLLFLLWGLDPAATKLLLQYTGISIAEISIIFFGTLTILSGCFLAWVRAHQILPEAKLSLRNPSLLLTAILFFLTALTTYAAVRETMPSHYTIPMTIAGIILTTIVNRKRVMLLAITWAIVVAGLALLVGKNPDWSTEGMIYTALSIASFTAFSIISERYKRKEKVSLRAAQYFFALSVLGLIFSLPLLAFSSFNNLTPSSIGLVVICTILISGLPYYIYYYLLSHREFDFVLRFSFLIIPGTILSESILMGIPNMYTLIAGVIVSCGAFLPTAYINMFAKKNDA